MNQRIRELAKQANANELSYAYYRGEKRPENAVTLHSVDLEKFAELIVQECINICEGVAADAESTANSGMVTDAGRMLHQGMYGGAKSCGGIIRQHFGVES